MQRGLGAGEFEPEGTRHDAEFTLGPGMIGVILIGLVVLCGLCFGLGYASGRKGAREIMAAEQPATTGQAPSQTGDSPSQPTATEANVPHQSGATEVPPPSVPSGDSAGSAPDPSAAPAKLPAPSPQAKPVQAEVKPALPPEPDADQPASDLQAQPEPSQAPGLMVQVTAVSHIEDAEVLVGALRRRGYTVTARREPLDGLIHVQVGPLSNRDDANAMCQRLLGDGYNASVRP